MNAGPSRALPLLALALVACTGPEPPLPSRALPLAGLASRARRVVESRVLDLGAGGERDRLWTGWGPDERGEQGSFVWGSGARSTLVFDVVDRRARHLVLRGWSFPFGDDPPQEVTVRLNGEDLGRRLVPPRPVRMEFEVAKSALRGGENLLELDYRRAAPADGTGLARAVAWDGLRLSGEGEQPVGPPETTAAGDLELPVGTAFEWTLELAGDAWLAWSDLQASEGARLSVTVATEDSPEERGRTFTGGAGRFRLSGDGEPHRLRRFSLRAVSDSGRGLLRLAGARLHLGEADGGNAPPVGAPGGAAPAARPNFLVYIIDTLRADHLGCYGYPRPTSPRIDAFARQATLFLEGRAQASWTRPAVATLLTGLLPITHQAQATSDRLPDRVETVAERLAGAGYQTAMITVNGNVAGRFGFRQGFERFVYLPERRRSREVHVRSAEVNPRVVDWLAHRDRARPFFLVVHVADPHDPYTPLPRFRRLLAPEVHDTSVGTRRGIKRLEALSPEEAHRRAGELSALYDAEIAGNDEAFGVLLDRLGQIGLTGSTAVFLVSDHGEEFLEHGGWRHGSTLYEEQLRVPFIVRLPGGEGAGLALPGPAEQIDLAPTLFELAGVAPPPHLPGRSLLAEIRRLPEPERGASFAFLEHLDRRAESVVDAQWKLIHSERPGTVLERSPWQVFALGSDPGEQQDLSLARPLRRFWLLGELSEAETLWRSKLPRVRARIEPDLARRLRALGYLR
jgi:arylsulfatase A-like enzyme